MTTHLSAQELVAALDKTLDASRQSHLDDCAACQTEVQELRAVVEDARQDAGVPEPSPLFWDHFHARVLNAVESVTPPASRPWWSRWTTSMPVMTMSAAVVLAVAIAGLSMNRTTAPPPAVAVEPSIDTGSVDLADGAVASDPDEWEFVSSVMGSLDGDDIHAVLTPSRNAVDAAIESLTSEEREAFVKLLKAEMGQGTE